MLASLSAGDGRLGRRVRALVGQVLAVGALLAGGAEAAAGQEALGGPELRVLYWPGDEATARQVLEVARTPLEMPGFGTVGPPYGTRIYVAPSPAVMDSLVGGGSPEWAGGLAIPSERLIVVPGYHLPGRDPRALPTTVRHEVAHLVVHEELPGRVPRWFTEGTAELASGAWDVQSAWQLRVAFALGRAPRWDSLSLGWPRGAERARLAYLLSATAVQHLQTRTGEEGYRLLLEHWREDGALEPAVRRTFGMSMGQLEDEWAKSVKRRYGWLQAATASSVVWVAVVVLVLLAWGPRRRRNRERLAEMAKEERMLMPPRPDGLDVEYPLS